MDHSFFFLAFLCVIDILFLFKCTLSVFKILWNFRVGSSKRNLARQGVTFGSVEVLVYMNHYPVSARGETRIQDDMSAYYIRAWFIITFNFHKRCHSCGNEAVIEWRESCDLPRHDARNTFTENNSC